MMQLQFPIIKLKLKKNENDERVVKEWLQDSRKIQEETKMSANGPFYRQNARGELCMSIWKFFISSVQLGTRFLGISIKNMIKYAICRIL